MSNTTNVAPAPSAKEEQQAQIPIKWRLKDHHVIETMVDDDGITWIKIEWTAKLHLFLALPQHREEKEFIAQIQKVGSINTSLWTKTFPQQPELEF